MSRIIKKTGALTNPYPTQDPFLFAVYHWDKYPAGDDKMRAPRRGNGSDFDWSKPYRMYHGDEHPGCFETVTCTVEGLIDHTDSLGNGGRYGNGDVQYMTAGSGIVHGEMFPLINPDKPNLSRFFQLWLNLPAKDKMVGPDQKMLWHERIPIHTQGKTSVRVWAGEFKGLKALNPTPNSWAANPAAKVSILFLEIGPGESIDIDATDPETNRTIYVTEGADVILNENERVALKSYAYLASDKVVIKNSSATEKTEVLYLAGNPIAEPVVQYGPFVMNTEEEIQKAFSDYRTTKFGGWPWDKDAVIFPRDKGRFLDLKGKMELPPKE